MTKNLFASPGTYAMLRYPGSSGVSRVVADGIWVQAVKSPVGTPVGYYDFILWLAGRARASRRPQRLARL